MSHNKWTDEEKQIIKDNYQFYSDKELTQFLPRHSESSITTMRKDMSLYRKGNVKYTFDDFEKYINDKGYILISSPNEYKNAGTIMKYICSIHQDMGIQETTLGRLLEGKGCKYCGIEKFSLKRRIKKEDVEQEDRLLCEEYDFTYVNTTRKEYKNGKTVSAVEFICNKHKELGVQCISRNNLRKKTKGCKYCHHKNLPKEYIIDLAKQGSSHIEIISDDFKKIYDRVDCYCTIHNKYIHNKSIRDIIKGCACYDCGLDKLSQSSLIPVEEAENRIKQINPNISLLGEYNGIAAKNKFKCKNCGYVWEGYIYTLTRCPNCEKFYWGEKTIRDILQENNIEFIEQYKFKECKDKRELPFDFYLPNNNICIEYNGEQHYKPIDKFGGMDSFKTQQEHDKIKRNYCLEHNITLLEIPYTYNTNEKVANFLSEKNII